MAIFYWCCCCIEYRPHFRLHTNTAHHHQRSAAPKVYKNVLSIEIIFKCNFRKLEINISFNEKGKYTLN